MCSPSRRGWHMLPWLRIVWRFESRFATSPFLGWGVIAFRFELLRTYWASLCRCHVSIFVMCVYLVSYSVSVVCLLVSVVVGISSGAIVDRFFCCYPSGQPSGIELSLCPAIMSSVLPVAGSVSMPAPSIYGSVIALCFPSQRSRNPVGCWSNVCIGIGSLSSLLFTSLAIGAMTSLGTFCTSAHSPLSMPGLECSPPRITTLVHVTLLTGVGGLTVVFLRGQSW